MSNSNKFILNDSYVLHRRSYRETSLIVDIFCKQYGRVSLIARGAKRNKSPQSNLLQAFTPLLISWAGRGELYTLTNIETNGNFKYLYGERLLCGYYINELVMRFLQKNDPHDFLYLNYTDTMRLLKSEKFIEPQLRKFERIMLQEIGYGLILDCDVESGQEIDPHTKYYYDVLRGPVKQNTNNNGIPVHGSTLQSLLNNTLTTKQNLKEAKFLMRNIIHYHLDGKPLKSRQYNRNLHG